MPIAQLAARLTSLLKNMPPATLSKVANVVRQYVPSLPSNFRLSDVANGLVGVAKNNKGTLALIGTEVASIATTDKSTMEHLADFIETLNTWINNGVSAGSKDRDVIDVTPVAVSNFEQQYATYADIHQCMKALGCRSVDQLRLIKHVLSLDDGLLDEFASSRYAHERSRNY